MLYCYDPAANAENWLHDGLVVLVAKMLDGVEAPLADWTAAFPEEKRETMSRKRGLKDRLDAAESAVAATTPVKRSLLRQWLSDQNNIPSLFDPAVAVTVRPAGCAKVIKKLDEVFAFGFKLLTALGVRDRQYEIVWRSMPARVCPFCGIEPMTSPNPAIPREALDHYLASSLYPLAATNLRNLAPAGPKCNESHKLRKDVLNGADGRRVCYDPFGNLNASVSLERSVPNAGALQGAIRLPEWHIDLLGDPDRTATWNDVYDIESRYRHNILDAEFRRWMDHFAQWFSRSYGTLTADTPLVRVLQEYMETSIEEGLADYSFLRRAVFAMLMHRIATQPDGPEVAAWIKLLVSPDAGAIG